MKNLVYFLVYFLLSNISFSKEIYFDLIPRKNIERIETWKSRRDSQVVKQMFDYSCGAASIATLLTYYFNDEYSEYEILEQLNSKDAAASFDDMKKLLYAFGYDAQGYSISFNQLLKIKIPVILFIRQKNNNHFVVLRGINESYVHVSDPSYGNVVYTKEQFLRRWETRNDSKQAGKILAVVKQDGKYNDKFFLKPLLVKPSKSIIFNNV